MWELIEQYEPIRLTLATREATHGAFAPIAGPGVSGNPRPMGTRAVGDYTRQASQSLAAEVRAGTAVTGGMEGPVAAPLTSRGMRASSCRVCCLLFLAGLGSVSC